MHKELQETNTIAIKQHDVIQDSLPQTSKEKQIAELQMQITATEQALAQRKQFLQSKRNLV